MAIVSDELPEKPEAAPSERLTSIDALRGFDMFWIVGGDAVARALGQMVGHAGGRAASPSSSSTSNGKGFGSTT